MNSFVNSFQHSVDLLSLSLLFSGFEVMLLKNAFVLCLKDEYTDSIRLLSPKGLHVVFEAQLLERTCWPWSAVHGEGGHSVAIL
jgi:hypothetical protein